MRRVLLALLVLGACGGDEGSTPGLVDAGSVDASPPVDDDCPPGAAWNGSSCAPSDAPFDRRGCQGTYGPVAESAEALFVDASAAAGGDGTAAAPFASLQAALDAAGDGAIVAVARGLYREDVSIVRPVTIEGRCARNVTIEGAVTIAAAGVAVRGLTVTGGAPGIAVHDAGGDGVELRWLRVEDARAAGVHVVRSRVAFLDGQVASTGIVAVDRLGEAGEGLFLADDATLVLERSIVAMNPIGVSGADATGALDAPTRTAASRAQISDCRIASNTGEGLRVHAHGWDGEPPPADAEWRIAGTTVSGNGRHGLLARATILFVDGSDFTGNGALLAASPEPADFAAQLLASGAELRLKGSDVHDADGLGMVVDGGSLLVQDNDLTDLGGGPAVLVRGALTATDNRIARVTTGIAAQDADDAQISGNTIAAAHAGIYVETSARAVIEGNTVSGVSLYPGLDLYRSGYGIYVAGSDGARVQGNTTDGTASMGIGVRCTAGGGTDVTGNHVGGAHLAGVGVQGCTTSTIEDNQIDGAAGHGVRVLASSGEIRNNTIENLTILTSLTTDGDGILVDDSDVNVSGNHIPVAPRAGILVVGPGSSGVVKDNEVGQSLGDIVFQDAAGMLDDGNPASSPAQSVPADTYQVDRGETSFDPRPDAG